VITNQENIFFLQCRNSFFRF